MNISGVVVRTKPEHFKDVLKSLEDTDLCEVHFHDKKDRVIVTIEGEGVDEEMHKMKQIQCITNVLSAELVYSYSEDEIEKAKNLFEKQDNPVPNILKDDVVDTDALLSYYTRIKRNV
jgi:nitrate reductase NapD